jgi:hypothetical protein
MVERIFMAMDRHGNPVEFELKPPTLGEENEGERQYRVAYSKALAEGVFPREKLREIMREHGMWTEDDDKELRKAVGKIAVFQIDLKNAEAAGDEDKCIDAARGISEARRRMWELFLVQQSVYMNSAEGVAEMIKTESIMAACTIVKSTGKRYWDDYAEYVRERDLNTKSTVYSKVVELQSNLLDEARTGLMEDYPEHQYLKSVEDRVLDRELEEQVAKELQSRAKTAIEADKKKAGARKRTTKKKVSRKKSGKRMATKTNSSS